MFQRFGGLRDFYHQTIAEAYLVTPPKTNMDTLNYGLEKVTPFKYGHFWCLC